MEVALRLTGLSGISRPDSLSFSIGSRMHPSRVIVEEREDCLLIENDVTICLGTFFDDLSLFQCLLIFSTSLCQ